MKSICNPITVVGPEPGRIGGITHDSREVGYDYVFVAMKGYETDGHQYIREAIDNGAQTIVHDQEIEQKVPDICYMKVEDTRALLGYVAQAYYDYPSDKLTVIGITGTNGKTTVATLVYQMLRQLKERPALMGTNGTIIDGRHLDSSLTTQDAVSLVENMHEMIQAGCTHLAMEVSSHALEQRRTNGIHFTVGALTNISHEHLDYHGSMDNYVRAKKRLFDQLKEDDVAILNGDDEYVDTVAADCESNIVRFGIETEQAVMPRIISHNLSGLTLQIGDQEISSPLCGRFNAYNLTEAFLIGRALGYSEKNIATALATCRGPEGRLQRINDPGEEAPTVYVDYAHTPDALENVLQTLYELKSDDQKLHVIFGCGGDRDPSKRPEMAKIAEQRADHIMVTSDNPRTEDPDRIIDDIFKGFEEPESIQRNADRREAIKSTIREAESDDIILIAGKGHETYQVIGDERHEFDDRQVARQVLTSLKNARNGEVA